jgi:hypothetical protein
MLKGLEGTMKSLSVEERQKLIKFKYRIISSDDRENPYIIQKKGWIRWKNLSKVRNREAAGYELERMIRQEYSRPGLVLFEYDHEEYLADKIKNVRVTSKVNNMPSP